MAKAARHAPDRGVAYTGLPSAVFDDPDEP
jgi:hypothetical protein